MLFSPPPAPPSGASYFKVMPAITVSVADRAGKVMEGDSRVVSLSLSPPPGIVAKLGGTTSKAAVAGVATFDDLTVDNIGDGYALVASAPGAVSSTSPAFTVATPATLVGAAGRPSLAFKGANSILMVGRNSVAEISTMGGSFVGTTLAGMPDDQYLAAPFLYENGFVTFTTTGDRNPEASNSYPSLHRVEVKPFATPTRFDLTNGGADPCPVAPDIQSDGTHHYIACTGKTGTPRLLRLDPTTGAFTVLLANTRVKAHVVTGGFIYYVDSTSVGGSPVETIRKLPATGGAPTTVVTGLGITATAGWRRLALVGPIFYWIENAGGTSSFSVCSGPMNGSRTRCDGGSGSVAYGLQVAPDAIYLISNRVAKKLSLSDFSVANIMSADDVLMDAASLYLSRGGGSGFGGVFKTKR